MIPNTVRIFVCTSPVDMRYGFDRLAQTVRAVMGENPEEGALFVFSNKSANRAKVLWFDRNGYCLLYKRLHRAIFELPLPNDASKSVRIDAVALGKLLRGVDRPSRTRA